MGNGTKVALVALLILMVVVIARVVRDDAGEPSSTAGLQKDAATSEVKKGLTPSRTIAPKAVQNSVAKAPASGGRVSSDPPPQSAPAASPAPAAPVPAGTAPAAAPPASTPQGGEPRNVAAAPGAPPASDPPGGVAAAPGPAAAPSAPATPPTSVAAQPKTDGLGATGSNPVGGGGESPLVVTRLTDPSIGPRFNGDVPRAAAPVTGGTEPRPVVAPPVAERLPAAEGFPKDHVIQQGDKPWSLAQRYYGRATVSLVSHLEKANPGVNPKALIPGKTYKIPAPPPELPRAKSGAAAGPVAGNTETATTRGQTTLTGASSTENSARPRPATETEKKASEPKEAKTSVAPPAAKETAKAAIPAGLGADRTYVVKKGETLSSIAKKFYGDSKLFYLIEDGNPDKKLKYVLLMEGDKIWIPPAR